MYIRNNPSHVMIQNVEIYPGNIDGRDDITLSTPFPEDYPLANHLGFSWSILLFTSLVHSILQDWNMTVCSPKFKLKLKKLHLKAIIRVANTFLTSILIQNKFTATIIFNVIQ